MQNVRGGLVKFGEKQIVVFRVGSELPGEKQMLSVALGVFGEIPPW